MTEDKKNPVGPPTKYKGDKTVAIALDYLETFKTKHQHEIPMRAGLALVLDISRETLNQWDKDPDKKKLSDALSKLDAKQEIILSGKGLVGDYNSTVTKLMLSNNHGYTEKKEQANSYPQGHPLDNLKFEVIKTDE